MNQIELDSKSDFSRLNPLQQIELIEDNEDGLSIVTTGEDGQLELVLNHERGNINFFSHLTRILLILAAVLALRRVAGILFKDHLFVPCGLLIALVLVVVMAVITGVNVHPDETVHAFAVNFYSNYW